MERGTQMTTKLVLGLATGLALVLMSPPQAHARWDLVFECSNSRCLAIDPRNPNVMFVGTGRYAAANGVFRTTNGGTSWKYLDKLPKDAYSCSILIDPQTPSVVLASFSGGTLPGLYASANSGESWTRLGAAQGLPSDQFSSYSVIALPTNPKTYLVGTYKGVYRSTDGGASWTASNTGLTNTAQTLVAAPSDPSIVWARASSGFYRSLDAGMNWSPVPMLQPSSYYRDIVIHPTNPNVVYVANYSSSTTTRGIYKTVNGGGWWTKLAPLCADDQYAAYCFAADLVHPGVIYVGGSRGVYKTASGGQKWQRLPVDSKWSTTWDICYALALDPRDPAIVYRLGTLYTAQGYSKNGLFKYTPDK